MSMSIMHILPLWFVYVAAALRIGGGLATVRATLRGEAHPNPVSWLLWSATALLTFVAAVTANGLHIETLMTLAMATSPLLVFLAIMSKNPRSFRLDRLNAACFVIALAGIALWVLTNHPVLAIILAISADMVSTIPIFAKSARHPYSEYVPGYLASLTAMLMVVFAAEEWNWYALAFPIYALVMNGAIAAFVVMKRAERRRKIRLGIRNARA
jgi:hypothetical protein